MVKNAAAKKAVKAVKVENEVPYLEAKSMVEGASDYTALVLIVDRSGSMYSIAKATQDALEEFINGQKALPGKFTVDSVFFDDEYEERAVMVNPKKEKLDLSIEPRGMTAMYDAIGKKLNSFSTELSKLDPKRRPSKVLVAIATDGMENASREYRQAAVAALIKEKQDLHGWNFTFLAANQDAVLTAKGLNIGAESAITYNASPAGMSNVIGSLNTYTSSVRSGVAASYSAADREAAMEE